jgi:Leucine-rich repeat (LRR) protein
VGRVFAECMADLPNVERVNIAGNSLTDHSLPHILDALQHMPHLTELNLSRNKIDDKASEALAHYVSNPDTPCVKLILQNADVDDFECAAFVETLKTNNNLRDLDLSHNLLGSAEILNTVFGGKICYAYFIEPKHGIMKL